MARQDEESECIIDENLLYFDSREAFEAVETTPMEWLRFSSYGSERFICSDELHRFEIG